MMKKGFAMILIISTLLSLSSCMFWLSDNSLDKSLHNQIQHIQDKNGNYSHIMYKGQKYLYAGPFNDYPVTADTENDVLLSWSGEKYSVNYPDNVTRYRSYTAENPVFIYLTNLDDCFIYSVYFREDYDYTKDTFVIDDTDVEIILENICSNGQSRLYSTNNITVGVTSKQYPKITLNMKLIYFANQWYFSFKYCPSYEYYYVDPYYVASDEFVKILSQNGIISTQGQLSM